MPEETNQPQPETTQATNSQTTNSPTESEEDKVKKQATVFATGLEDYARWKTIFTERDTSKDPPFRRGRIWA
ncbi:MAG: cyanobactin biosynthesis PatC/TenC/TruC family protein [Merismopedia sp. SIO2A8]|nr:cyanobactin biosynthesis PatC/TenC/TruC family protein [Symploca sp. SIO2B6]NET47308.1 cyanobactin biosynthesis PatC/TenC/TruC family protein [Merismopedia sp. SIO2A8]